MINPFQLNAYYWRFLKKKIVACVEGILAKRNVYIASSQNTGGMNRARQRQYRKKRSTRKCYVSMRILLRWWSFRLACPLELLLALKNKRQGSYRENYMISHELLMVR